MTNMHQNSNQSDILHNGSFELTFRYTPETSITVDFDISGKDGSNLFCTLLHMLKDPSFTISLIMENPNISEEDARKMLEITKTLVKIGKESSRNSLLPVICPNFAKIDGRIF